MGCGAGAIMEAFRRTMAVALPVLMGVTDLRLLSSGVAAYLFGVPYSNMNSLPIWLSVFFRD